MSTRGLFGERLAGILEARDIPAKELALKSGLSRRYVNALLSGERKSPTLERALAIARALGVSLDWLATGETRSPEELTPVEQTLVDSYRVITSERIKAMLLRSAKDMAADELRFED